jgi:hypothetical protein
MSGRVAYLGGVEIVESPIIAPVARFKLADNVPVTQEFRDDFNRWAREFFGVNDVFVVSALHPGKRFTNPGAIDRLKARLEAEGVRAIDNWGLTP